MAEFAEQSWVDIETAESTRRGITAHLVVEGVCRVQLDRSTLQRLVADMQQVLSKMPEPRSTRFEKD